MQSCLNHHSESPCFSFASTEIWAYIQLGISQMTPRSKRGLHKNLKSKDSQFCEHSHPPVVCTSPRDAAVCLELKL